MSNRNRNRAERRNTQPTPAAERPEAPLPVEPEPLTNPAAPAAAEDTEDQQGQAEKAAFWYAWVLTLLLFLFPKAKRLIKAQGRRWADLPYPETRWGYPAVDFIFCVDEENRVLRGKRLHLDWVGVPTLFKFSKWWIYAEPNRAGVIYAVMALQQKTPADKSGREWQKTVCRQFLEPRGQHTKWAVAKGRSAMPAIFKRNDEVFVVPSKVHKVRSEEGDGGWYYEEHLAVVVPNDPQGPGFASVWAAPPNSYTVGSKTFTVSYEKPGVEGFLDVPFVQGKTKVCWVTCGSRAWRAEVKEVKSRWNDGRPYLTFVVTEHPLIDGKVIEFGRLSSADAGSLGGHSLGAVPRPAPGQPAAPKPEGTDFGNKLAAAVKADTPEK